MTVLKIVYCGTGFSKSLQWHQFSSIDSLIDLWSVQRLHLRKNTYRNCKNYTRITGLQDCRFIKKETQTQLFFVDFAKCSEHSLCRALPAWLLMYLHSVFYFTLSRNFEQRNSNNFTQKVLYTHIKLSVSVFPWFVLVIYS